MNSESNAPQKKSFGREVVELFRFVLIVLAIVVPIRIFVAQPFIVNGESMVPTLENGDYLIIDEISYRARDPQRGEVIVFRNPTNTTQFLIKRIIGLPGEQVQINGSAITIMQADGTVLNLDESYITTDFSSYGTWNLNEDEYFAMGDNRGRSLDSRAWGALPRENIVGTTLLRLFPLSHLALQPGHVNASEVEVLNNVLCLNQTKISCRHLAECVIFMVHHTNRRVIFLSTHV